MPTIYEEDARKLYRKWDNVKHISEALKENGRPRKVYQSGLWGLSIKTKERLDPKAGRGLRFGIVVTLNKGLEKANGEYIARMDADDISLPTRLEKEINFLDDHHEYAIVSTPMIYFDEHGYFRVGKGNGEVIKSDFIKGTPFCHAPCMVRSEAYRKVKGYTVAEKLLRVEDYHLWYKMYLNGYRGYNLKEPLYKMRDDRNAKNRRKYKYRINEANVKYLIVRDFNLSKINYIRVLKPLIVGLLPTFLYDFLHRI